MDKLMHLKKVLIIDESERSKDRLNVLINNITDYQVDIPKNPDDAKKLFDSNFYCFVIIEHNCKIANDFMSFVLEHNPKQKMILLSDSLNCPIDCDTCTSNFNFVRLLKPITIENITQFLVNGSDDDFICPNKYRFDNIDSLEKLYEFIYLDENYFYT